MIRRRLNLLAILVLVGSVAVYGVRPAAAAAPGDPAAEEASKASDVAAEYQVDNITRKAQGAEPETTTSSTGGKTLLYGGIAAAAVVGAVALAAGSGGGGSSSSADEETPVPEVPKKDPVGANVDGDNWVGSLTLFDNGQREAITASVRQNGADLEITTSTAQKYGKKFIGTIGRDGNINATDQGTGEVWSTHFGRAYWNKIDLYDYVHNDFVHKLTDFDRLYLERYSKN